MASHSRPLGYLASLLTLAACCSQGLGCGDSPAPTPGDVPERRPDLCAAACERWREMGCETGKDACNDFAPDGETCTETVTCDSWCESAETTGSQPLNLQCITTAVASSCSALEVACIY